MKADEHLDALFKVGSVRREKAMSLFNKILSKIEANPDEEKYQNLNHTKISAKFDGFRCPFMVELLVFAGFVVEEGRLRLRNNNIAAMSQKLTEKIAAHEADMKREKLRVIDQNKQRLANKENVRSKPWLRNKDATRKNILAQHKEQMKLASQGIYNVGASVSDRKGSGQSVNSLGN